MVTYGAYEVFKVGCCVINDDVQIYATEHMNSSSSGSAAAVHGPSSSASSAHSTSGLGIDVNLLLTYSDHNICTACQQLAKAGSCFSHLYLCAVTANLLLDN